MIGRGVLEDLLDEHVGPAGRLGQPFEVAAGVDEPVRVVDAQAVGEALAQPPEDLRVGLVEDPRHLDPNAGEGRDR